MFGFSRDVLPELEVEVNVTHLDTLESLPVILSTEWRYPGQEEVCDDTNRPHVRGKSCSFSINNFRCYIFWLTVFHLNYSNNSL